MRYNTQAGCRLIGLSISTNTHPFSARSVETIGDTEKRHEISFVEYEISYKKVPSDVCLFLTVQPREPLEEKLKEKWKNNRSFASRSALNT